MVGHVSRVPGDVVCLGSNVAMDAEVTRMLWLEYHFGLRAMTVQTRPF